MEEIREYRTEALTLEKFINQLACHYIKNGYFFYVTGWVPEGKPLGVIDWKLVEKYDIAISKYQRHRRKQHRIRRANLQYLRHARFFCLLATEGQHRFFSEEGDIRDCRKCPLKYGGYSVSHSAGHVSVRLDDRAYRELKAHYLNLALKIRSASRLGWELFRAPVEPYSGVTWQLKQIVREVNRIRKRAGGAAAGFAPVDESKLRANGRRLSRCELIDARIHPDWGRCAEFGQEANHDELHAWAGEAR